MRFNTKIKLKAALAVLLAASFLSCSNLGADLSDAAKSDAAEYYAYLINGASLCSVRSFTVKHTTSELKELETIKVDDAYPWEIAVHPSRNFSYILYGAKYITVYSIDSTGVLTATGATASTGGDPCSLNIHPSGKFAYVVNTGSNNVTVYSIAETGELTAAGTVSTGDIPISMKIHPSGKFAYVLNKTDKTLTAYSINSSGMLSATGSSVATGAGPSALAIHPSGKYAYVVNNSDKTVSAYSIDSSGQLSLIGSPVTAGKSPYDITIDPSDKFVYVCGNYDWISGTYDPEMYAYSISSTGKLISMNSGNPVITATGYNSVSITFVPKSNFAYVIYSHNDTGSIDKADTYTIDSSGTLKSTGISIEVGGTALSMIVVRK